jgi:hypothetical protein
VSTIRAEIQKGSGVKIEPLSIKREWMDNIADHHAYICFPVSLTNGLGWGISFPEDIVFIWDGIDTDKEEGHIKVISGHKYVHEGRRSATISLNTETRFVTDENTSMLTMPIPNLFLDSVIPYTTLISTSFYPHPLPAALKVIKPNVEIILPANKPILSVLPISLKKINDTEVEIYDLEITKEENLKHKRYGDAAQAANMRGEWTNFYRNATDENGISVGNHEVKSFRLKTTDFRSNYGNK